MIIKGTDFAIKHEGGKLTGTDWAVEAVKEIAKMYHNIPVGLPAGPYTTTTYQHLRSSWSVAVLAQEILEVTEITGHPNTLEGVPGGALV